ncbi:hypothetical protein E2C01_047027 [Portunus trituberculatus]|uniref:Uncharacterized protein n=1 Tax=Portunus trituberculatus TaxID=210409 RepID=A0A5B7G2I8_PORTR|nr:hypothetical protein [Portunus trituberculatus]
MGLTCALYSVMRPLASSRCLTRRRNVTLRDALRATLSRWRSKLILESTSIHRMLMESLMARVSSPNFSWPSISLTSSGECEMTKAWVFSAAYLTCHCLPQAMISPRWRLGAGGLCSGGGEGSLLFNKCVGVNRVECFHQGGALL